LLARISHHTFNRFVLTEFLGGRRREASTFLGVNYYGLARFKNLQPAVPAGGACSKQLGRMGVVCDDMFERHPDGLGVILRDFHRRYGLPLYITEHGAASSDENFRIRDLTDHLHQLHGALNGGADVRGFFYWSLLDNFEWQFGYAKKFGLVAVDFTDPAPAHDETDGPVLRPDLPGQCGWKVRGDKQKMEDRKRGNPSSRSDPGN